MFGTISVTPFVVFVVFVVVVVLVVADVVIVVVVVVVVLFWAAGQRGNALIRRAQLSLYGAGANSGEANYVHIACPCP